MRDIHEEDALRARRGDVSASRGRWRHAVAPASIALFAAAFAAPATGHAQEVTEPWFFTVDLGVTGALNDPPRDQFGVGGDSGVGVYASLLPELALGPRLRVGILSEGDDVLQDPVDRGQLDYGIIAASMRVRPFARLMDTDRRATGLWLGASAGGALLDGDVVPAFDTSIGYNFGIGPVAIGPRVTFTHFVEVNGRFGDTSVSTLVGGLELAFMDHARPVPAAPEPRARVAPPAPEPEPELALLPEPMIFETPADTRINDALVIDERVFFDYDSAELRDEGRAELDRIVAHHREYGDGYARLVVAGHADSRGPMEHNEALSQRRADAVVDYLATAGIPREVIDARGYGELRPVVADANDEWDHQINRRVAFRVEWTDDGAPVGVAPDPRPSLPRYVDEAPERVAAREGTPEAREREERERQLAQAEVAQLPEGERVALERERRGTSGDEEGVATARADEPGEPRASLD